MPFQYPPGRHARRHGPRGYGTPRAYRQWLRDEFTFRCVYCLLREQWGRVTSDFDVEHFRPQAKDPTRTRDYDNLLYSCKRCNQAKQDKDVPDPCVALVATNVIHQPDGTLVAKSADAKMLIRKLALNADEMKRMRMLYLRIIDLARTYDQQLYETLQGFPFDLPNLSLARPPGGNSRPKGVLDSHLSQRLRGILPKTY